jgi:hypothetical protein
MVPWAVSLASDALTMSIAIERTWPAMSFRAMVGSCDAAAVARPAACSAPRLSELSRQLPCRQAEIPDRIREFGLRRPGAADVLADVTHEHPRAARREVRVVHDARVTLELNPGAAPQWSPTSRVPADEDRVPQLADMDLNPFGRSGSRLSANCIAAGQHPRRITQHGSQLAEDTARGAGDADHGIGREDERVDRERHSATDQNVEQPYLRRRGQGRDENGRYSRLSHEQLPSPEDDRSQHRQHHEHPNLRQPDPDHPYQQIGEDDSQHHPSDQLHRPLAALPERRAQRDHCRDRRERRPMLDPQ